MGDGNTSASLFAQFITSFDTRYIYEAGWESVQVWTAIVTGILISIAITVRTLEEKVNLIGGGQAGFRKMASDVFFICFATAMYFFLVTLVIDFFNAIYGVFNSSKIDSLGNTLSETISEVRTKEYKFDWRDIFESILGIFPLILFSMSKIMLVVLQLFMKLAHSILVVMWAFYGAFALPLAIIKGLNMLKGFKVMGIFIFLWPIIENYFLFLTTEVVIRMLDDSSMNPSNLTQYDAGVIVFFLTAFVVINALLIAATFAAPFVAMAMAANSGNVIGMVASFGAAGLAAGAAIGRSLVPKPTRESLNSGGKRLLEKGREFMGRGKPSQPSATDLNSLSNLNPPQGANSKNWGSDLGIKPSSNGNSSSSKSASSKSSNTISTSSTSGSKSTVENKGSTKQKVASTTATASAANTVREKASGDDETSSNSTNTTNSNIDRSNNSEVDRKKKRRKSRAGYFANKNRKGSTI